jgi:hypothetical protein
MQRGASSRLDDIDRIDDVFPEMTFARIGDGVAAIRARSECPRDTRIDVIPLIDDIDDAPWRALARDGPKSGPDVQQTRVARLKSPDPGFRCAHPGYNLIQLSNSPTQKCVIARCKLESGPPFTQFSSRPTPRRGQQCAERTLGILSARTRWKTHFAFFAVNKFVHRSLPPTGDVSPPYSHNFPDAIWAPSASARSLAQTMLSATIGGALPTKVPKPQSTPAMTRSRPTMSA